MVQYIKDIIQEISSRDKNGSIFHIFEELHTELSRLDPRDFQPSAQARFVIEMATLRANIARGPVAFTPRTIGDHCGNIKEFLDAYGGPGNHVTLRDFSYITNDKMRNIITRDYREIMLNLYPSGSWKGTVIMCGSVLEAVLDDVLFEDTTRNALAVASAEAPKKGGIAKPRESWKLFNLIEVAVDLGHIKSEDAKCVHQSLRDYRNFVHPNKELRVGHECGEYEAQMAHAVLNMICDRLPNTL